MPLFDLHGMMMSYDAGQGCSNHQAVKVLSTSSLLISGDSHVCKPVDDLSIKHTNKSVNRKDFRRKTRVMKTMVSNGGLKVEGGQFGNCPTSEKQLGCISKCYLDFKL